jgi:Short C-terminal domain
MSLLRSARRVAVASAVHGRVQQRQRERWAAHQAPAAPEPPPPASVPAAPPTDSGDLITALERLGKLRDAGVLTEEEFAAQKARLLG